MDRAWSSKDTGDAVDSRSTRSTLFAVLAGVLERPASRGELGESCERPASLELHEDILDVQLRIKPEQEAVIDECVCHSQSLAAAHGAGEKKVAATYGKRSNAALDAPVVDLESPVLEAATQEVVLTERVGRCSSQRRLWQEFRVELCDPPEERVEDGQGALATHDRPSRGVETSLLAVGFNPVEVGDVFDRDGRALVLREQRSVELATHVHQAAEPLFVRYGHEGRSPLVLDLGGIARVTVALDIALDRGKPRTNLLRLPAGCKGVANTFRAADRAVGADEAPEVSTEPTVLRAAVEHIQARVIGAHDRSAEHSGDHAIGHGLECIRRVGEVGLQRLVGNVETHAREFFALTMQRQAIGALVLHEFRDERRLDAAADRGPTLPRCNADVFATAGAGEHLADFLVHFDPRRHEHDPLMTHGIAWLLLCATQRASPLLRRDRDLRDVALDERGNLNAAAGLAFP